MNLKQSDPFINRELSWLEFNHRVLSEGMEPSNPLFEKLKFIGIVSSNLDEFFMVRVASLKQSKDPVLALVRSQADQMQQKQNQYFRSSIVPALKKVGLVRLTENTLNKKQKAFLKNHFDKELFPILTPIALVDSKPNPILVNLGLYLLVSMRRGSRKREEYAIIEIPEQLQRIIFLKSEVGHPFILLEDVISLFANEFFAGCKIQSQGLFRVTREAELDLDDAKDEDFSKVMTKAIAKRRQSSIIRLEISAPDSLCTYFKKKFKISDDVIIPVHSWMDLKSVANLAYLPFFNELKRPIWSPRSISEFDQTTDIWQLLKQRDIYLHHPYDSFDPVIRFVNDAAEDPHVVAIKQTLYRTEHTSAYISALEKAAENGKKVTVLVELKARFNEEKNIKWASRLQAAGVNILYGIAGFKTHAKVCLVIRKELEGTHRYVHLSTGNHNEKTAKLYSDIGYFTSNEAIAGDVSSFFNVITGYSEPAPFSKIEIAPYGLKSKLLSLIQREIQKNKKCSGGFIEAKMNSLVDADLIQALYKASQAGIQIHLNIRGTCCLRPGVKGMSENIHVVSIVDMFLEHSRIFHFSNGGKSEIYLSSADWMPRNLERRIEIMFPVEDRVIKQELIDLLKLYFKDNTNSWKLLPTGKYEKKIPGRDLEFRVQSFLCQKALDREISKRNAFLEEFKPKKPIRK